MSNGLKNIEDNVKGAVVLYTKETNVVNPETGEYVPIKSTQVVKEHTRTSFIQLYTQNIDFLISKDLTDMERRALLYSFNEMNYYNIIRIDSGLRKRLEVASKLSQGSVSKAIKGLIDKGVFLKINIDQAKEFNIEAFTGKEYVINPNLVGRGSFKEMKNMRQTVVTNFDFETLTMKKEITLENEDIEFENTKQDLLNGKSEIVGINQSYDEKNNVQRTDIKIADVEENRGDYSVVTLNPTAIENKKIDEDRQQERNIIEYEDYKTKQQIELLREQNKSRELALEEKKIDLEILKMKSKETKQGSLFENN